MTYTVILAGLFSIVVSSLHATTDIPQPDVRADSVTHNGSVITAQGHAVAVVGETRISADQISYDANTGILKCVGEATVRTPKITIKATDATINIREKDLSIRAADVHAER